MPMEITINPEMISRMSHQSDIKLSEVKLINVIMTRKCNLRCDYCVEDKDLPDLTDWNVESFNSMLKFFAEQSDHKITISFFGGEPLLKWKLIKELLEGSVNLIKSFGVDKNTGTYKFDFNISTNGHLIDDDKLRWIEEFVHRTGFTFGFMLSIDTFSDESARKLYKKDTANIDHLFEVLDLMADKYPYSIMRNSAFRMSVKHNLVHRLKEDIKIMLGYRPDNIIVHPVTTDDPDESLWTEEKWQIFKDAIIDGCKHAIELGTTTIECMEGVSERGGNCGAGKSMVGVDADGGIYACYFSAHARDQSDMIGNFKEGKIFPLAAKFSSVVYTDSECQSCDKKFCHQCHIKNIVHSGQRFCSASWCKEIASIYEEVQPLIRLTFASKHFFGNSELPHDVVFAKEAECLINSISAYIAGTIMGVEVEPPEHCGCESVDELSTLKMVEILDNLTLLKNAANKAMIQAALK